MSALTDREKEIIDLVKEGNNSPTLLAEKLGISQSGASQALQKLAGKGMLVRSKTGKTVRYESSPHGRDAELSFLFQSYNALSQVWAYVMSLRLTEKEVQKAREARDTLEKILSKRK